MRTIVGSSLRLSGLVLLLAGALLVAGVVTLGNAPVDTMPEYLQPHIQVQTAALGLSATEVEEFITVVLEDDFNGLAFLEHMRSKSVPGLSSIQLTLRPGTDVYKARQLLTERIPAVMVNVGTPPVMIQPMSSQNRLMMIGLSAKTMSLLDLSTLARWRIKPRLLAVPGVSNVTIWGQRDQQLQVLVDPKRMAAKGITLDQVIATTGDAFWTSPLTFVEASSPGADGLIDTPNQRLTVQHVLPIRSAKDLAAIPIDDTKGRRVTLGDVATVVEAHPLLAGDAVLKDGAGFFLVVEKSPNANTLEVTRQIEDAVASLKPGLAGVTVDTTVFRPASFIETALRNVGLAALAGLLLMALWLGVALRSWRAAVVSALAVTVSFVAAALVLYAMGTVFNVMTLSGLVIALGVIVDDAVVAVVGVRRRAAESRPDEDRPSATDLITNALIEGRRPLGHALAIILITAAPLLLWDGPGSAFARPLMIAYILAVVASALVAVIVTPALARLLVTSAPALEPGALERWAERSAETAASALARRPVWAYASATVLLAAGVVAIALLPVRPEVPAMRDRNLQVQWAAVSGTSLPEMDRVVASAGAAIRSVPGVRGVGSHVGQAFAGDRPVDVDSGETWIALDPAADYDATVAAIRRTLGNYVGLRHTLGTYRGRSLDEAHTDNDKAVTVRLYGTDPKVLEAEGRRAVGWLSKQSGIVNAHLAESASQEPVVRIVTDPAAAGRYGLKPGDIRRQTAVLVGGLPVASYYANQQIFDVTVWSVPTVRRSVADIENLPLDAPKGGRVPLKNVATVTVQPGLTEIDHDTVSRYVDVTADVKDAEVASVLSGVQQGLLSYGLPLGYRAAAFSDLVEQRSLDTRILLLVLAAAIGVYLLLQSAFRSWSRAALVFLTLPLAAVGGLLAALLTDGVLTLGALLGFFIVLGLAARHSISIVQRCQDLERACADEPRADLAVRAAGETAFPALLTAAAIALAVLPFIVRGNIEGMEILRPLALVVIGGLVTSTLYSLVVLPALYARLDGPPRSERWDPRSEESRNETP